jgi:hypothetical protein
VAQVKPHPLRHDRTCCTLALSFAMLGAALGQRVVAQSPWECATLGHKSLVPAAVEWTRLNCSGTAAARTVGGESVERAVGPIVFNVITTQLSVPGIRVVPVSATDHTLHTVPELMSADAVAGINGGYFWRVDETKLWIDDVCVGKTRADALRNASLADADAGVGDSVLGANGSLLASNCDRPGNSRPAALVLREEGGGAPHIEVLRRGGRLSPTVIDAIGAGPNLVSVVNGSSVVDIKPDDDNVNIYEHAANAAVALRGGELLLVTADGHDGCKRADPTCGIGAHPFAAFLLQLGVSSAMGMDQGGSTTLWASGQGVVSNPGQGARSIFDALAIEFVAPKQ